MPTLRCQVSFPLRRSGELRAGAPSDADIEALRLFARSTKLSIDTAYSTVNLDGMSLAHYQADPELHHTSMQIPDCIDISVPDSFVHSTANLDLCLEDSWSGFFVARHLTSGAMGEPLVLIHLDDHTDMMSTLLRITENDEAADVRCCVFDPSSPEHWVKAIGNGAVGIGSFVTALYYREELLHVLHLRERANDQYALSDVYQSKINHQMIPGISFADITLDSAEEDVARLGTYSRQADPLTLLNNLPTGRVIMHVDLDYFINDYNGNIDSKPEHPVAVARERAVLKMDALFHALNTHKVAVERWIVGVSPGFCGVSHWQWLLATLEERAGNHKRRYR